MAASQVIALILCSALFEFSLSTGPVVCRNGKGMENFLSDAGIAAGHAKTYAQILKRNHIDAKLLTTMSLTQLSNLGIKPYGDRLKISQYFTITSDSNECGQGTLCQNGGVCKDGFRCFSCECSAGYYGPTCAKSCLCKNSGKCLETVSGFTCECIPGFTGVLCEKQWLSESRFQQLEDQVKKLDVKIKRTEEKLAKSNSEVVKLENVLADVQSKHNTSGWSLKRVDEDLNKLAKIALHAKTPTYIQKIPFCLPKNTKAVLISVFINFWNKKGHAYLDFKTHQQGNLQNGSVTVKNEHYAIYANTFYYELMLPWNTELPEELVFVVKNSYQTGGVNNWYQIRLVGYITA